MTAHISLILCDPTNSIIWSKVAFEILSNNHSSGSTSIDSSYKLEFFKYSIVYTIIQLIIYYLMHLPHVYLHLVLPSLLHNILRTDSSHHDAFLIL